MKKTVLLVIVSSLISTKSYNKSVYPSINRVTQGEDTIAILPEDSTNESLADSTLQKIKQFEKSLTHLYWAHQTDLAAELKKFKPHSSGKALKHLKKNISQHLAKKQKTLDEFAEEIKQESASIETCLNELAKLAQTTTNPQVIKHIEEIKKIGDTLKQNLVALTSRVNKVLLDRSLRNK